MVIWCADGKGRREKGGEGGTGGREKGHGTTADWLSFGVLRLGGGREAREE